MKRLSNKYGKNSKNNKFKKILHLEREKVKKGFEKSSNFANIAKVRRIFFYGRFMGFYVNVYIKTHKTAIIQPVDHTGET